MSTVLNVVDDTFDETIKNSSLVVIDFWAEWCMPCKMIEPIVEQLAQEYEGKAAFGKMNIDENKNTPAKHGIMSIPTLLIFKDGELVDKIVGVLPKEKIEDKLKTYL